MIELLPIGAIAAETGATVTAIRYYEELGIIEPVTRVGGKRRFHPDTIGRVSFIRRAQQTGFSLDEIRLILDDETGGWIDLVEGKIDDLTQRRAKLDWMLSMLGEMRDCGCDVVASCPRSDIFEPFPNSQLESVGSSVL